MRRQDFIDNINTFDDLLSFCDNNGYEQFFEDYVDEDYADECLNEMFVDVIREFGWSEARDQMNNQDTGYTWYRRDAWGDLVGCDDDDFESLKDEVLDYVDDDEAWDDEEPVEEEYEPEPDPEPCVQDEDAEAVDVDGLLAVNSQLLVEMAPAACACEEGAEGEQPPENEEEDDGCGDDGEDECVSIYDLFLPSEIINVGTESA